MQCRLVKDSDAPKLFTYFQSLSATTKSYFGPHPFDEPTLIAICSGQYHGHQAFVTLEQDVIVGYVVIKQGYLEGELYRYPHYDLRMDTEHHYLFAPSIADSHQSKGIGSLMLKSVEDQVREFGGTHLILWGGVQARNQRAIRYYEKNGFKKLGDFYYDGLDNWDMMKDLNS